ncbi:MAG: ATP synthase F1 subunit delta [Pirellulales bacterium]
MSEPENKLHPTVLDSDAQQVGSLYGKAILAAAGKDVDEIVSQLNSIVQECLAKTPGLEQVLGSPRVSQVEKEKLIDRIFRGKVHTTLLNFLKVLCRRGRIDSLRGIQVSANEMRDEQLGRIRVTVTSAFALTDDQRKSIAAKLGSTLGKDVVLDEQIDESLLGGILIRIGDQVFDGTVLGKMSAIRLAVSSGINKAIRDKYASLLSS